MLRCLRHACSGRLIAGMCPFNVACAATHLAGVSGAQPATNTRSMLQRCYTSSQLNLPESFQERRSSVAQATTSGRGLQQLPRLKVSRSPALFAARRCSSASCSAKSLAQGCDSDLLKPSPRQDREYEAAKNSAAGSLSLRPHSRKELEIKLKDKGYSDTASSRALDRLKELVCP